MKVLVTGAAGFIAGYLVPELLRHQHQVVGVDNFSKYGPVKRSYDGDPGYQLVEGDAKNVDLLSELALSCDQVVAGAAMIGGISYFHEFAYDLLAENERILAATFDAAINACRHGRLKRIAVISSSMVFESATVFPTPEGAELTSPPPVSTYGFQKLASEYFARGAWQQYQLPYTIMRPFNCVGIGERRALRDDFNLSTAQSTTVAELAAVIWRKVHGPDHQLHLVHDPPFEHDVARRIPDVQKARRVLGFEARTTLDEMLDEVIPWVRSEIEAGRI